LPLTLIKALIWCIAEFCFVVNRKTCLLVSDPRGCSPALQTVNGLLDEQDKLLLGVGDGRVKLKPESVYLPFKLYELSWNLLKDLGIQQHLARAVHRKKRSVQQLLKSTLFLDILLFDPATILRIFQDVQLRSALYEVRCPIMIIDEDDPQMKEVFLVYSGSAESFKAIQRFCYLFRDKLELADVKLVVRMNHDSVDFEECVYDYIRGFKRNFSIQRIFEEEWESTMTGLLMASEQPTLVSDENREVAMEQFLALPDALRNRIKYFIL